MVDPPPAVRGVIELSGHATVAWAPMLWEDRGVGSICAMRQPPKAFTDKELALLKTFGDQAVIAIQNARLFNETKEALEQQTATSEVLDVISHSMADASPVFEKIIECCERLFSAEAFALGIVDDDGQLAVPVYRLTAAAHASLGDVEAARIEAETSASFPRPLAGTLTEQAIRSGKLVEIRDVTDGADATQPAVLAAARMKLGTAVVVAPLMWEGRGIGSLTMMRREVDGLRERENALLKTFADQAVIAIQNARLFNETKEALERQTATSEILRVISESPTDVHPVLQAVAQRAGPALPGGRQPDLAARRRTIACNDHLRADLPVESGRRTAAAAQDIGWRSCRAGPPFRARRGRAAAASIPSIPISARSSSAMDSARCSMCRCSARGKRWA